ncbi:putative subtilisin-like protease pr1a protein [Eutypa lata UCREL1]|uniref:Putative subtilisin-like protease pr1a protein n=1 Tax=Eutypa lata (strain UCR-EL1) TaxID=1287681 RepID=M7T4H9_EUTLA|nr:putative subtilisin-like protease pr1a protein [Eutypa lata UCREL1]
MHVFSTLCLASLSAMALAGPVGRRSGPAPIIRSRNAELIADKYIVVMNKDVSTTAVDDTISTYSSNADSVYNSTIRGFAGALDDAAIEELRNNPGVAYIEQDAKFTLAEYVVQNGATWGISRLSHRDNTGSSDYYFDDTAGDGTCSYVIDTGINVNHEDFGGRAEWLQNFSGDGDDRDGAGHGTYVAGIIGSNTYGVAKKTRLFALKVFDDNGVTTGTAILDAMDFAAGDHPTRGCPNGVTVNMSLGGGFSQASNDATDALVDSGAFVAVASGNDGQDAAGTSPASAPKACTVGASNSDDVMSSFSNFGEVVDIFAPGEAITSTAIGDSNQETTTASGTSAASPHIAGLAAYLMTLEGNPGGEALCERIKELSTTDILQNIPDGTGNRLAFNGSPY